MLTIENLHVSVAGKPILKGINLTMQAGEVHAIMGPNGSGKSTLANVIAGQENYIITQGDIRYEGQSLLTMTPEMRARAGVFLAFQYPSEIPGVSNMNFLKTSVNAHRKHKNLPPLDAMEFIQLVKAKGKQVQMNEALLYRSINEGFSGGEKKRNEILQMLLLEPKLMVLDETDSGLDIDALQIVAQGVNALRDPTRSFLMITHYQRLLDYIVPDHVHVLAHGKIIKSGDKSLALELEKQGYGWITDDSAILQGEL